MTAHPLLAELDLRGRGLEIGALHHPIVEADGTEVLYVDHASTEELRAKYADDTSVADMVDVDVVWGDRPLRAALDDALGSGTLVDFVVASHVVEHVPDLLGWLHQLAAVLRSGGVVALAIPDKRYCFDARRRETDVADVLEAHLTDRTRPPLGATFDFWTKYDDDVDAAAIWTGAPVPPPEPLRDADALERTRAAAASADYADVHCWVFTPRSFADVLRRVTALGLLPQFELQSLRPTAPASNEFHVVLRRVDQTDIERQVTAIDAHPVAAAESVPANGLALSPFEQRLIKAKRAVLDRLHRR